MNTACVTFSEIDDKLIVCTYCPPDPERGLGDVQLFDDPGRWNLAEGARSNMESKMKDALSKYTGYPTEVGRAMENPFGWKSGLEILLQRSPSVIKFYLSAIRECQTCSLASCAKLLN